MDDMNTAHPDQAKAIGALLEQGFHILVVSALLHVDPRIVKNRCRSRTSVKTKAKFSRVPSMLTLARDGLKWREVGILVGAYLNVADKPFESISADALIAATRIYQSIHLSINGGLAQEHMLDGNAAFSIAREYRDGTLKYVSCPVCKIKFAHLLRCASAPSPYKCPVCHSKVQR
ncbi:hypothetical protein D3C81_1543840 [compost metagenome]